MPLRPLRASVLLAAAALCILLAAQGNAHAAEDCCLNVPPQPRHFSQKMQNWLTSYRTQGPQTGCLREAIVFVTKKGRELCISPDADWAPALMRKIDARNQRATANRLGA